MHPKKKKMDSSKEEESKEEDFHFSSSLRHKLVYGTINGSIGVIASLTKKQFKFLEILEHTLRQEIKGCGGFELKKKMRLDFFLFCGVW